MFAVGVAFVSVGYVLLYHGIDVLQWAQSGAANANPLPGQQSKQGTRPVPLSLLFGAPLPTAPPTDTFLPIFHLSSDDTANPAKALGGGTGLNSALSAQPAVASTGGTGTGGLPGTSQAPAGQMVWT